MKRKMTKLLGAIFSLLLVPSMAQATITATWDWGTNNPEGIQSLTNIQNTTATIESSNGVILTVDATASGAALRSQSGSAQFNAGTKLFVPVVSTLDIVTFVGHSYNYAGVIIGGTDYDASSLTRTHTATAAEVAQGYVVIESKGGYLVSVSVELAYMPLAETSIKVAWDWEHDESIRSFDTIQHGGSKETGSFNCTVNGQTYTLQVDCTVGGKFGPNGSTPQFTTDAKLRVPVTSTTDVVTVKFHPSGFTKVTIGGNDYTTTTTRYTATATDVTQGYVEIISGGSYLYSVILEKMTFTTATIGSTGWATFSNVKPVDFTALADVVTPYIITGNTGTAIESSAITTAAASTGLLLKGAAGTYAVPFASTGIDYSATNKLVAVSSTQTISAAESGWTNYVLSKSGDNAVFMYISTTPATVGAGKAYLHLNIATPAAAPVLSIDLDNGATGIEALDVTRETLNSEIFNLNGQRVAQPTRGLYIVNGKKVIMK